MDYCISAVLLMEALAEKFHVTCVDIQDSGTAESGSLTHPFINYAVQSTDVSIGE